MVTLKESILKSVRAGKYAYFPKTKEELAETIKKEIDEKGNNCSLNHINISNIEDLSYLFSCKVRMLGTNKVAGYGLHEFDGDISGWDVKNVENMHGMFFGSRFTGENGDISGWDVRKVKNMGYMFTYSYFNTNIAAWDVSKVNDMCKMFYYSKEFNQNISNWVINDNCDTEKMFYNCPIKKEYEPKCLQK